MTRSIVLFFSLLSFALSLQAVKETIAGKYRYAGPFVIHNPLIIDQADVNNNSWSDKNLLQTEIDIDQANKSITVLSADTSGIILLPQDSVHNAFHLFSFHIDADRYVKAQLAIQGTGFFEVFVNGKKEGSNTYAARNMDDADPVYVNLSMLPSRYAITVKYLTTAGKNDTIRLKSQLKLQSDTLAQCTADVEEKRRLTLYDIIEGYKLTDASVSPSGKYFLASYREFYSTEKSYSVHELREIRNNRLICRFPSSEKPFWMPSSDRICFWRAGKINYNLVAFNISDSQETVLAEGLEIESATITPDEQYLIIRKKDKAQEVSGSLKRLQEPDDRIAGFRDRGSLYRYRFSDKTLERITFGHTDAFASDISRDSRKLLFYTYERDLNARPFSKYSFFLTDLQTWHTDTLVKDEKYIGKGVFSPDGKKILFEGMPESFNKAGENILPGQIANAYDGQAFIMDITTRSVDPISKDFNPSISGMAWNKKDQMIYLRTVDGDYEKVYRYDPATKKFEQLPLAEDIVSKFSLAEKERIAIYYGQSVSNSNRLYTVDLKSLRSVLLADPMGESLKDIALGEVTDWNFNSSGGTTIHGRYYLPPGFDASKKYPLIVYYYGGTTPTPRLFEMKYPLHAYAALGYVVYTLQPSGTIGYGQEFSARHVNAWGKQTADEIIEGTLLFCKEHTFVNQEKIGCIGASYGGFMTQYLQTRTDIFAAAVSHAGISNIASYWGEGYWGYSYSGTASADSYPWNNPELYVEQSPLFHADKINTPLLLLHGTVDTNVPLGESIQMFNALKILGKPVEFIQVEGENHGINAYKKRLDWNNSIFAWFAKWLKDEPTWWNTIFP